MACIKVATRLFSCRSLAESLQAKSDYLRSNLEQIGFKVLPAQGTYFLVADFRWTALCLFSNMCKPYETKCVRGWQALTPSSNDSACMQAQVHLGSLAQLSIFADMNKFSYVLLSCEECGCG